MMPESAVRQNDIACFMAGSIQKGIDMFQRTDLFADDTAAAGASHQEQQQSQSGVGKYARHHQGIPPQGMFQPQGVQTTASGWSPAAPPPPIPPRPDTSASPQIYEQLVVHSTEAAQPMHYGTALGHARLALLTCQNEACVTNNGEWITLTDATRQFRKLLTEWANNDFDFTRLQAAVPLANSIMAAANTILGPENYANTIREIDPGMAGIEPAKIHSRTLTRMLDTVARFNPDPYTARERAKLELLPAACLLANYAHWLNSFSEPGRSHLGTIRQHLEDRKTSDNANKIWAPTDTREKVSDAKVETQFGNYYEASRVGDFLRPASLSNIVSFTSRPAISLRADSRLVANQSKTSDITNDVNRLLKRPSIEMRNFQTAMHEYLTNPLASTEFPRVPEWSMWIAGSSDTQPVFHDRPPQVSGSDNRNALSQQRADTPVSSDSSTSAATQATPQKSALEKAHAELVSPQHISNFVLDQSLFAVATGKAILSDSLMGWAANGIRYDHLEEMWPYARAIIKGAGNIIDPRTFAAVKDEMERRVPQSSDPDHLYLSLELALNHAAAFTSDVQEEANGADFGFIAAAWCINEYVNRLYKEAEPHKSHETVARRYKEARNDSESLNIQPPASQAASVISPIKLNSSASPSIAIAIASDSVAETVEADGATEPALPTINPKIVESNRFKADFLVAVHADNADPIAQRSDGICANLKQQTDFGSMLALLKQEIAGLPVAPQIAMYRAQRQSLMQSALEGLKQSLPINEKAASQLVRELRRVTAPAMPSSASLSLHRTHAPKAWQAHIANGNFDSREIVSDAARVEFCTRALSLALPESASIHIMKTMKHWFNECTGDWQRSKEEYISALSALAALRADPHASFTPKCVAYAEKILEAQTKKLWDGAVDLSQKKPKRDDFADRLEKVEHAMKMSND